MTPTLHEAWFYERQPGGRLHCTLCPHDCRIADGSRGACSVRFNERGVLYTLVYDRVVASNLEPIEKKPFFHFKPGSLAYSIATVGCNQQCTFCQNWEIAQWARDELPRRLAGNRGEAPIPLAAVADVLPGLPRSPETIVDAAVKAQAASIAYTFTEPRDWTACRASIRIRGKHPRTGPREHRLPLVPHGARRAVRLCGPLESDQGRLLSCLRAAYRRSGDGRHRYAAICGVKPMEKMPWST